MIPKAMEYIPDSRQKKRNKQKNVKYNQKISKISKKKEIYSVDHKKSYLDHI